MSSMSSFPRLNWTSFKVLWNATPCIAPSTASLLGVGPHAGRTFPILPNISGALGTDSPSNQAYSRGQGYAFPQNSSTAPLLACMEFIKASIGCKLRWGMLCIGQCTICTKHKASPPTQPMLPRDVPDGPCRKFQWTTWPTRVRST